MAVVLIFMRVVMLDHQVHNTDIFHCREGPLVLMVVRALFGFATFHFFYTPIIFQGSNVSNTGVYGLVFNLKVSNGLILNNQNDI